MSPISDTETRRRYQRQWIAKWRAEFFADKTCIDCGTIKHLELDRRDPSEQVNHRVWSWSTTRREAELAKYEIRCSSCRRKRLVDHHRRHGTRGRYEQGLPLQRVSRGQVALQPARGGQKAIVSGGRLRWVLIGRTNTELGTSEIWSARAVGRLSRAAIKASLSKTGYKVSLTVVAFSRAPGTGASKAASAITGAPNASLTTTQAQSWVFAVGNDSERAVKRTVGPGQTLVSQATDAAGDTHWVQSTKAPTNAARTRVTINDTAPTKDRWNLELIEIL